MSEGYSYFIEVFYEIKINYLNPSCDPNKGVRDDSA
jgi:hypothetical protein